MFWGIFGHTHFLNDPVIANQSEKFNIYLIIIDLENTENCTAVVFLKLSKKLGLVHKSRFFK